MVADLVPVSQGTANGAGFAVLDVAGAVDVALPTDLLGVAGGQQGGAFTGTVSKAGDAPQFGAKYTGICTGCG